MTGALLSTQSPTTAQGTAGLGKAQLAASLGVDPEDHTAAELARMFLSAHD